MQLDLKQQLNEAVMARKTLERTYENQFKLLGQFVLRLSLLCKGIDLELDNRLAKLRTELAKNSDLEKLIPFIEETSNSLQLLEKKQQQDIRQVQQDLTQAGRILQQQRGLPDQLRRDLRQLLSSVEQPTATLHAFLPQLSNLTQLYQLALKAKQQQDAPPEDDERYAHICRQITLELNNLLSELTFTGKYAVEVDQIKSSLMTQLSIENLLDACLRTISIIVHGINEERLSAESFLIKLNEALNSVQQAVEATLQDSGKVQQKLAELNQKIEGQIAHLGQQTEHAESLEQLKLLVINKMNDLTLSLKEKERIEKEERAKIHLTLMGMEKRVKELEQEALSFKDRLTEQNFRSLRDTLTGIPNRAAYDERLNLEFKRAKRFGSPLCIIVGDVDYFKNINDNYGHSAGDKTLKVIAKALQQSIRQTDFIARYGGEEFVILMPETNLKQLVEPLNLLREKIKKIPFKFKNQSVPITISFGATQLLPDDTPRQAFDRADEALYQAKKDGRDRISLK